MNVSSGSSGKNVSPVKPNFFLTSLPIHVLYWHVKHNNKLIKVAKHGILARPFFLPKHKLTTNPNIIMNTIK